MVAEKYCPARNRNGIHRMPSSSITPEASIQKRNSIHRPKPFGARTRSRTSNENAMGIARITQTNPASPSAHHTGNNPKRATTGHP